MTEPKILIYAEGRGFPKTLLIKLPTGEVFTYDWITNNANRKKKFQAEIPVLANLLGKLGFDVEVAKDFKDWLLGK